MANKVGLKILSQKFRDDILSLNLKTPPDIVAGLADMNSLGLLLTYEDSIGKDVVIHNDRLSVGVKNPGNLATEGDKIRKKILSRNRPISQADFSALNANVDNLSYTYQALVDGIGKLALLSDYSTPTLQSINNQFDFTSNVSVKLNLDANKYIPTEQDVYTSDITKSLTRKNGAREPYVNSDGEFDKISNLSTKQNLRDNKYAPDEITLYENDVEKLRNPNKKQEPYIDNNGGLENPSTIKSQLNLKDNLYIPQVIESFHNRTQNLLQADSIQEPYVNSNGSLSHTYSTDYSPIDFIGINVGKNSLSRYGNDPVSYIKTNGKVLQNETLLMNVAALQLKFNYDTRVNEAIARDSMFTNINDAMTDPVMAINIMKDPKNNLFSKNYNITIADNPIGRAANFTNSLFGTYDIYQYLTLERNADLTPNCFVETQEPREKSAFTRLIDDLFGKSIANDRDASRLAHTGSGQKFQLFSNLYFNKYAPNYDPQYETGLFSAIDDALQAIGGVTGFLGFTGGKRPKSRYYFGDKTLADPFFVLSDAEGDQVKGVEDITRVMSIDFNESEAEFYEPGYDQVSSYGSVSTDFIWHKNNYTETFYDNNIKETTTKIIINRNDNTDFAGKYSGQYDDTNSLRFRECSILYKTQRLLEKAEDDSAINLAIDQTKTKFFDGYTLYPKGSGVLNVNANKIIDKLGNVVGYGYSVPGLEQRLDPKTNKVTFVGKRNATKLNDNAEFCRTWTKTRPYTNISNAMRYSELIRLERNSVLDANGNLNIFPSDINVNKYSSRSANLLFGDKADELNQVNAKKYMFSIENLAWRDTQQYNDLPSFEKGFNGGRVMWFPPYDIKFTDDTNANWTSHQFLGRPEPIYTYNSTERTGTLSWKIIVDHPTILNVLVQKELDKMTDESVDEILASFWSGCIQFDIYELARIWGQFSDSDIRYFQQIIDGIDKSQPNSAIRTKMENSGSKEPQANPNKNTSTGTLPFKIDDTSLFFENDMPLSGSILTYDTYFTTYQKLAQGDTSVQNAEQIKGTKYGNMIAYDKIIGSNSDAKYFNAVAANSEKQYQIAQNYTKLQEALTAYKDRKGYNLDIDLVAFTSPLNNDSNHNNELAGRRWKSVVKWIVLTIFGDFIDDSGNKIDESKLDDLLSKITNNTITLKRNSDKADKKDTVTIKLGDVKTTNVNTVITDLHANVSKVNGSIPVFKVTSGATGNYKVWYCTDTTANKVKLLAAPFTLDGKTITVTNTNVGAVSPDKPEYTEGDIVCSVLSIESSYARRVDVSVNVTKNPDTKKESTDNSQATPVDTSMDQPTNSQNITKRTIAQRILNKLITEKDYFEYLKEDSPTVYKSLKEKLKYFTPSFHSITPEGLNSRLTFMQQCLRPGDTIRNPNSIDAVNTAFGKPPVCVLRIGDFYNTKIIINNLNITYEPLVWDLNPEGIGVQPMIANVNISFKYLGGSGLRQHVNKLQNALSFNYYANADVYDDRTFANTNPIEQALVNLETNPFNANSLDLIPIVEKARIINPADEPSTTPEGLVGEIIPSSKLQRSAGLEYYKAKQSALSFSMSIAYEPDTYVLDTGTLNYYKRLYDDKTNNNPLNNVAGKALSDTTAWVLISNKNYGEYSFGLEYGNQYINTFDVNYRNIFKNLYINYIKSIKNYLNEITFDDELNKKSSYLAFNLINRCYTPKVDFTTNTESVSYLVKDNISTTYQPIVGVNYTTHDYYKTQATNNDYVSYLEYSSDKAETLNPFNLYLYPQLMFYTVPKFVNSSNRTTMYSGNTYNPGDYSESKFIGSFLESDVSNFYIKNPVNNFYNFNQLNTYLQTELNNKINADMPLFMFTSGGDYDSSSNLYNRYVSLFDDVYKTKWRTFLINKLNTFIKNKTIDVNTTLNNDQQILDNIHTSLAGISSVLMGYDARLNTSKQGYEYFATIPNEKQVETQPEDPRIFGYDPYMSYLSIYEGDPKAYVFKNLIIDFKNIKSIITNGHTTDAAFKEFYTLGNGLYFFRQISRTNTIINSISNGSLFDNNITLPKSLGFDDNIDTSGDVLNYIIANTSASNIAFDPTTNITSTEWNNAVKELNNENLQLKYKLTYTFEKLSHEFLEFTNKNLGVILNDKIGELNNKDSCNIDFVRNNNIEFRKKLSDDIGDSTAVNIKNFILDSISKNQILFFTGTTTNNSNTTITNIINQLNNMMVYKFTITQALCDQIKTNAQLADLTDITTVLNLIVNKTYNISAFSEIFFLDFFEDLIENKDANISQIQSEISAIKPSKGIVNLTGKAKINAENKRISDVKEIIVDIFDEIESFVDKSKTILDPLADDFNTNITEKLTGYLDNVYGITTSQQPEIIVENYLMKGGEGDYTVNVRQTNNIPPQALENIQVYMNNRANLT